MKWIWRESLGEGGGVGDDGNGWGWEGMAVFGVDLQGNVYKRSGGAGMETVKKKLETLIAYMRETEGRIIRGIMRGYRHMMLH